MHLEKREPVEMSCRCGHRFGKANPVMPGDWWPRGPVLWNTGLDGIRGIAVFMCPACETKYPVRLVMELSQAQVWPLAELDNRGGILSSAV